MTFTVEQRLIRLDRARNFFFPDAELCTVVTDKACTKTEHELTTDDLQCGLEEGVWPELLLRKITDKTADPQLRSSLLPRFLNAIYKLENKPREFFVWSVDHAGNGWAPVWVRSIDRLHTSLERYKKDLTAEQVEQIQGAYLKYKDGPEGIDARREAHKKTDAQFWQIFGDDCYKEVAQVIVQPITGFITPKHFAKFIFEIGDEAKQLRCMQLYIDAIQAHPEVELSKKLVEQYKNSVAKFSKEYEGALSVQLLELGKKLPF